MQRNCARSECRLHKWRRFKQQETAFCLVAREEPVDGGDSRHGLRDATRDVLVDRQGHRSTLPADHRVLRALHEALPPLPTRAPAAE